MRTLADRRGISLLEAVVGLAMVAMTVAAAVGATGAQMRAMTASRRVIEASTLAAQPLNQLDLLTNNELLSLPDSVARGRFERPFEAYSWNTKVSLRDGEQGVYDVLLRVTWPGGNYTVASAVYRTPPMGTTQ